jgi:outer membrane autotransporter protein
VTVSTFTGPAHGSSSGLSVQAQGEIGYRFEANLFSLEPFAGLSHLHLEGAQVRESGSAAALVGRTRDLDVTASLLGLRATAALPVGTGALSVNGTLAWRHTFEAPVPRRIWPLPRARCRSWCGVCRWRRMPLWWRRGFPMR